MRRVGLLMVLVLAGGCTAVTESPSTPDPAEPTGISLPARPRDLRIDGVEPCSLLTEQQRAELGLDGPQLSGKYPSALFKGDEFTCVVRGFSPRAVSVGVGVVTTAGIDLFTDGDLEASVSILQVQGYPAVMAVPRRFERFCSVLVDVAPGQLLDIQYSDGGRVPPIPQEQLCRDAQHVADAAMYSLLGR